MAPVRSFFQRHRRLFPYLIYFISLCYLAFLLSSTQPGTFFSGDGGMKYIVVKQLDSGHGFKTLYLPQPEWVHQIWNSGYFPFSAPFIYPSPEGDLFSFPPYFQLVSAIFYRWFGYWGVYILPVCSAVLLWWCMIGLLRAAGWPESWVAALLFILVFCSPLTLYGAIYWEHMPAVLLLCGGYAFVLLPGIRRIAAAALGLCAGLAVWLRPEALVMDGLLLLAGLVLYRKGEARSWPFFAWAMGAAIAGFFGVNYHEYGSILGVHSYQVIKDIGFVHKVLRGGKNLLLVNWISIFYFPFLLLLAPVLAAWWRGRLRLERRTALLTLVLVLFCILTPWVLPNEGGMQWGARYFLPVIPLFLLVMPALCRAAGFVGGGFTAVAGWRPAAFVLAAFTVYAFVLNSFAGGEKKLREANFHRVRPALDFVKGQPGDVIVVGSGYVPMEMGSIFNEKYFFLAQNDSALGRLQGLLRQQHIREYLYINQVDSAPRLPNLLLPGKESGLVKQGNYYFARYAIPD
jgi:hypothetical protein